MEPVQPITQPVLPALTPKDREMLAWFLGARLEPRFLTREDLEPAALEAWARSPHIAAQIHGFRYMNNLADESIRAGNYIDAHLAVGADLRAASSSIERLRAVNAFIRLSNSRAARPTAPRDTSSSICTTGSSTCATGSPRRAATSATPSTSPPRTPADRADQLPALPSLPSVQSPGIAIPASVHPTTTAEVPAPQPNGHAAPTPASPAPHSSPSSNGSPKSLATPAHQPDSTQRPSSSKPHPAPSTPQPAPASRAPHTEPPAPRPTDPRPAPNQPRPAPDQTRPSPDQPRPAQANHRSQDSHLPATSGSPTENPGALIGAWP